MQTWSETALNASVPAANACTCGAAMCLRHVLELQLQARLGAWGLDCASGQRCSLLAHMRQHAGCSLLVACLPNHPSPNDTVNGCLADGEHQGLHWRSDHTQQGSVLTPVCVRKRSVSKLSLYTLRFVMHEGVSSCPQLCLQPCRWL